MKMVVVEKGKEREKLCAHQPGQKSNYKCADIGKQTGSNTLGKEIRNNQLVALKDVQNKPELNGQR